MAGPMARAARRLQGKDLWLVATTGGPQSSYHPQGYNRYFFDAFLPPYEQTAALCGMRFLPPLMLHGARSASEQAVAEHVAIFAQRLQSIRNGRKSTNWSSARRARCRPATGRHGAPAEAG